MVVGLESLSLEEDDGFEEASEVEGTGGGV